jgi:hypothetical protein
MNLWLALAIFLLSVTDDLLVVWYMRRVVAGKRGIAGLISGILTALISLEVCIYATDVLYIPFNCIGSVIGTWLAIWIDTKWPSLKEISMRVHCPQCGRICKDIMAEITTNGIGGVTGTCKKHGRVALGHGWSLRVSVIPHVG